jgi:hypothetical protein
VTIQRGRDWGERRALAAEGLVVGSDAELRAAVTAARRAGEPLAPIGLAGGDLWRTLGGPGVGSGTMGASGAPPRVAGRWHSDEAMTFPVDVGSVLVDGIQHWFVAHLVARRSWWRGRIVAAMNAEWLGGWDVAPRSHPNDGLLDVLDVAPSLGLGQRRLARRRLPTGAHLPHPEITTERAAAFQLDLGAGLDVWLDGEPLGRARHLSVRVEPDALAVVV